MRRLARLGYGARTTAGDGHLLVVALTLWALARSCRGRARQILPQAGPLPAASRALPPPVHPALCQRVRTRPYAPRVQLTCCAHAVHLVYLLVCASRLHRAPAPRQAQRSTTFSCPGDPRRPSSALRQPRLSLRRTALFRRGSTRKGVPVRQRTSNCRTRSLGMCTRQRCGAPRLTSYSGVRCSRCCA